MSESHLTGVFNGEGNYYQAICSCGWLSTISFLEEVDLLRALHAHQVVVFGEGQADNNLSDGPIALSDNTPDGL